MFTGILFINKLHNVRTLFKQTFWNLKTNNTCVVRACFGEFHIYLQFTWTAKYSAIYSFKKLHISEGNGSTIATRLDCLQLKTTIKHLRLTYSLDPFHLARCLHVVGSQKPEDDNNRDNNNKGDRIVRGHQRQNPNDDKKRL